MFGMRTDSDLKIILGVLVFLLAVMGIILLWHYIRSRTRRRPEGTMSLAELKGLEGKLTKEELNAVRHAMARQYLQNQEAPPQSPDGMPMKPLEALALEAQRAEIELAKRAAGAPAPKPAAVAPPPQRAALLPVVPPSAEAPPEGEACSIGPREKIPDDLKPLLAKPLQEIEDMRNAGFLSEEDFEIVARERQRAACPRCSGG